jgi:hypothetical protein
MTSFNTPDMLEATRLTREGRFAEASALLQRLFRGEAPPAEQPAASSLSDLRDPVCGNRLGGVIRSWFRGSPLHEQLPPDQPRHRLSAAAIGG